MRGLLLLMLLMSPLAAFAGEANVQLNFTKSDQVYLFISLVIGGISLLVGFMIRSSVLKQSPGDEKMQEVGGAIHQGALAYLRQQVMLMIPFVVIIMVLLYVLYQGQFGSTTAMMTSGAFLLGVAASYTAGWVGMDTAVRGNMRTAAAALTSYAKTLETAFRSGAVAGLITVGIGLVGATAIFFVGGAEAMKILVGFGFGGSLAALFMRVGGGIFTKAADVGADLVGKVEAGIPEDDPRNPAVIADNVGDNVGDCAGMAADVFESYEVTLVAAIVLGAATASIFDQTTWMRLILFALMARGVGILGSIVGIFMVKGSDDVNHNPLHSISKGFNWAAGVSMLLTAGVAWFMLNDKVSYTKITTPEQVFFNQTKTIKAVQKELALKSVNGDVTKLAEALPKVKAEDVQKDAQIKELGLDKPEQAGQITQAMSIKDKDMKEPTAVNYTRLSLDDKENKAWSYAVQVPFTQEEQMAAQAAGKQLDPKFVSLREFAENDLKKYQVLKIKAVQLMPQQATDPKGPQPPPKEQDLDVHMGPMDSALVAKQIEEALKSKQIKSGSIEKRWEVFFMTNKEGELAIGVGNQVDAGGKAVEKGEELKALSALQSSIPTILKATPKEVTDLIAKQKTEPSTTMPDRINAPVVGVAQQPVEWYRFFLCIFIGILMAYVFERLTDYYVSLDRAPVREIATVSSAGPAPMIIQGFSLAAESSVFSVLAIVFSLLAPLFIFPPEQFGGYILSFYGIALVGLGLLTCTGFILAMDTFGPISDNAQGVFEMSGAGHANPEASRAVQLLDAAGNTTKALTKGFAIATAVVAAVALFHSYVEDSHLTQLGMRLEVPEIFLGLMIGGAAPYLFSAFSINAVGRAAFDLINNVRAQFKNDPGIMAGTSKPDYAACVQIVTRAAQRELLGPGILAIFLPVAVAFGFALRGSTTNVNGMELNLTGAQALGGFLAGCIVSGQLFAVLLANSGGMWDNSKKLIEDGMCGGKGTDAHKAAVVCDTVGDPFKDTAGPALNPLIKVMNLVALLLAPVIVQPMSRSTYMIITLVSIAALGYAFWFSKRGGMGSSLSSAQDDAAADAQA